MKQRVIRPGKSYWKGLSESLVKNTITLTDAYRHYTPGGTSLQDTNGDVLLDWVAFSGLDWLSWGRTFNRVTRMGWHVF